MARIWKWFAISFFWDIFFNFQVQIFPERLCEALWHLPEPEITLTEGGLFLFGQIFFEKKRIAIKISHLNCNQARPCCTFLSSRIRMILMDRIQLVIFVVLPAFSWVVLMIVEKILFSLQAIQRNAVLRS